MIIQVNKLVDFASGHSVQAEIAIMNAICYHYDLEPAGVTKGNSPEYDFQINHSKIELKISSKGMKGTIELSRADGSPGGLSATKSDLYAFLNPAGKNTAKLRLVRTSELKRFYKNIDKNKLYTYRDPKLDITGSLLAPLDLRNFDDLFVLEMYCDYTKNGLIFDTHTSKPVSYARRNIRKFIL